MTTNTIEEILNSHKAWVESGGKIGNKASFMHVDFTGSVFSIDLSGASFTSCNLKDATFETKIIKNVRFKNCNLTGLKIEVEEITSSTFESCNLSLAGFSGIHFQNVEFKSIQAETGSFIRNSFSGCLFEDCKVIKSNFDFSTFNKTKFKNTSFTECSFIRSGIFESEIKYSDFTGSNFLNSASSKVVFTGCNFKNTKELKAESFNSSKLENCEFDDNFDKTGILNASKQNFLYNHIKNIFFYLLNLLQFAICISCTVYFLSNHIDEIKALSLAILLCLFIYVNNTNSEYLIKLRNPKIKIIIALNYIIALFFVLILWKYSLKFEHFGVSISILIVGSVLGIQSFLTLKTIFQKP